MRRAETPLRRGLQAAVSEAPPLNGEFDQVVLGQAIVRLDGWLESMRGPDGYGGPVSHWWQSSLVFCGPMADWRYEGIMCGYLELFVRTGERRWLSRAKRAGDDLVRAQLPNGNFLNSGFEEGARAGGTPHEAAADVALFELALALRRDGDPTWPTYAAAAERNVDQFLLGQLWDGTGFRDEPGRGAMVANKNATVLEALLLAEQTLGRSFESPIRSAAARVYDAQVPPTSGARAGATVHLGTEPFGLAIGIYTARCAAALVRYHAYHASLEALTKAQAMGPFLTALCSPQGTRFGRYRDGRLIRCPTWISPSAEVLRALLSLKLGAVTLDEAPRRLASTLIGAQYPSGGLPTARGLGWRGALAEPPAVPDFRDALPVVGWCGKVLRVLSLLVTPGASLPPQANPSIPPEAPAEATTRACTWLGRSCHMEEQLDAIRLREDQSGDLLFDWRKGDVFPHVYRL